jgi:hypothetical protein
LDGRQDVAMHRDPKNMKMGELRVSVFPMRVLSSVPQH